MNARALLTTAMLMAGLGLSACHKTETNTDINVVESNTTDSMTMNDMMANDTSSADMMANEADADENQHIVDPHK